MTDSKSPYPDYDVLSKWDSPSWNDQTRAVVRRRLHDVPPRRFLSEDQWTLLEAIADRIIPQGDREEPVPIVPWIDEKLHENRGPGYRFDFMPPMREAWTRGIDAVAAEAVERHGKPFEALAPDEQDALLGDIQHARVNAENWHDLPADAFFTHLLLEGIAGVYYAHPSAWNEIGFGGPASPRGYVRLGFNQRDSWEGEEVPSDAE